MIKFQVPKLASLEQFVDRVTDGHLQMAVDVSRWVRPGADLEQVAFLAVYPSGEVRGVSAYIQAHGRHTVLNFTDPICFLDPVDSQVRFGAGELSGEFDLVALELPRIEETAHA